MFQNLDYIVQIEESTLCNTAQRSFILETLKGEIILMSVFGIKH
jgi:hypothetical protein